MANPETVRFFVYDENEEPLAGVLVRVFSTDGIFITQAFSVLTDDEAIADMTLSGDEPALQYYIRPSKSGVAFDGTLGDDSKSIQSIFVYSPASLAPSQTNDFVLQGQTFVRPAATNPLLCRASGFFKDISGRPASSYHLKFTGLNIPLIVNEDIISEKKVFGRTDDEGYFVIDLYRNGKYLVEMDNFEEEREVTVPDASSVALSAILFPVVATIVFSPESAAVTVGEEEQVTLTVTDTAGNTHQASLVLSAQSSDEEVALVTLTENTLTVCGRAQGAAFISFTQKDSSIVTVPSVVLSTLLVSVNS